VKNNQKPSTPNQKLTGEKTKRKAKQAAPQQFHRPPPTTRATSTSSMRTSWRANGTIDQLKTTIDWSHWPKGQKPIRYTSPEKPKQILNQEAPELAAAEVEAALSEPGDHSGAD